MTVTVSVDATWRLSRVEFNTAHNAPWDVRGMGEVLLQEAEGSTAPILGGHAGREGEKKTYGTMPSTPVSRIISEVAEETVDVGGTIISFETIMQALPLFFERWRVEDAEKPLGAMIAPKAAPETQMATPMQPRPTPEPVL